MSNYHCYTITRMCEDDPTEYETAFIVETEDGILWDTTNYEYVRAYFEEEEEEESIYCVISTDHYMMDAYDSLALAEQSVVDIIKKFGENDYTIFYKGEEVSVPELFGDYWESAIINLTIDEFNEYFAPFYSIKKRKLHRGR